MPPEPAVPGLVTVTGTIPGVAMAVAGIMVVSWPAVIRVVVCFAPFQLMTAFVAKLLPLTVKVNWGSPEFAVLGTSCATAGMTPGCGAIALGELYPHPRHTIVSNNTEIVFIISSQSRVSIGKLARGKEAGVRRVLLSCRRYVCRLRVQATSQPGVILGDLSPEGSSAQRSSCGQYPCA